MVLLHIKNTEKQNQFIYECKCSDSIDDVSASVVQLHNYRLEIRRFATLVDELAKYGPARNDIERGLSHKILNETVENPLTVDADMDPTARRIGQPPDAKVAQTLTTIAQSALDYTHSSRAERRQTTTMAELQTHFEQLKAAVISAYPNQLPQYDPIQNIVEGNGRSDTYERQKEHDPKTAQLWFAAKKLQRGGVLSQYIGKNEKTKIVIKITKEKGMMPVREPTVDEETRKQMMAFWHRRQQIDKALAEDDDTSYLQSKWANPNALKQSLSEVGNIAIK